MSAPCNVLAPVTVTAAMIVSSTATETQTGLAAWNSATAYALGARCISTVTHRIYESVSAGSNTNHDPTNLTNQFGSVVWWVDQGPTNRFAMFDGEVSTQTVVPSPLQLVLRPGVFNSIAMLDIEADQLDIVVRDAPGGNIVYSHSGPLESSQPADYYEYFFDRFKPQTKFLATGIDAYNNAEVTVTLSRISGDVKCGLLALGDMRPLGEAEFGAQVEPVSHSYIETDKFGKTKIVRRSSATGMSLNAQMSIADANTVVAMIQELLDVPCIYSATDLPEFAGLTVFGLGSATISYVSPKRCILNLKVKGLI